MEKQETTNSELDKQNTEKVMSMPEYKALEEIQEHLVQSVESLRKQYPKSDFHLILSMAVSNDTTKELNVLAGKNAVTGKTKFLRKMAISNVEKLGMPNTLDDLMDFLEEMTRKAEDGNCDGKDKQS